MNKTHSCRNSPPNPQQARRDRIDSCCVAGVYRASPPMPAWLVPNSAVKRLPHPESKLQPDFVHSYSQSEAIHSTICKGLNRDLCNLQHSNGALTGIPGLKRKYVPGCTKLSGPRAL
eukprot:scaffold137_cov398-Prasinococcus_capsulatus_cf.AAC.31